MAPSLQVRAKPKAWGKSKRQPLRLRENAQDKPDAIQRRVDALAQVLQCLGALHPGGAMTTQLQSEWHLSCRRLAQSLVTSAEAVTITSAVRTGCRTQRVYGKQGAERDSDLCGFGRVHPRSVHDCSLPCPELTPVVEPPWTTVVGACDFAGPNRKIKANREEAGSSHRATHVAILGRACGSPACCRR